MAGRINREAGMLAFYKRVLAEASAPRNPLMERVNFLGIVYSGLKELATVRLGRKGSPGEVWVGLEALAGEASALFENTLAPLLHEAGVHMLPPDEAAREQAETIPLKEVSPNEGKALQGLCAALVTQTGLKLLALPEDVPALLEAEGGFVPAAEAVLARVRREHQPLACGMFRLLRAAHASCGEGEDVAAAVAACMDKRRRGKVLRLVHTPMPQELLDLLCEGMDLPAKRLCQVHGLLETGRAAAQIAGLAGCEELRYPPYEPHIPQALQGDVFAAVRERDWLLCHPYDSFAPVTTLLKQAAEDPRVEAIRMTLYRVSGNSTVTAALKAAAARGVEITVFVEPRARMDERQNLRLMEELTAASCRVCTGPAGLKVHGKAMLISRREDGGLRRYAHFSTGNYHEGNAARYTDFGLLTADEGLCADAESFFRFLALEADAPQMRELTASPFSMRQEALRLIRREMEKALRRQPCGIRAMLNALTDGEMIEALEEAARCGVPVNLTVRGACCLIPGENEGIAVSSVVGRYLEHGRAFAFGAGEDAQMLISSADWMKRSLDRRVELMIPVKDESCRRKLLFCMNARQDGNVRAWRLKEGGWATPEEECLRDVQTLLMEQATSAWPSA